MVEVQRGEMIRRILQNWFVKWVFAPVAVICALGWGYFQINYPTCTLRYKLTVDVMTPEGLKTGSSVIEVNYQRGGDWGGGPHGEPWATGEAVYVDLGQGKNLFVLLSNRESGRNDPVGDTSRNYDRAKGALDIFSLPIKMFGLSWTLGHESKLCQDFAAASSGIRPEVPFNNLPTLVTFRNLNDPKSVAVVQPDRFETDIDVGFKFLDAKIESTIDSPKNNIEAVLPWLPDEKVHWVKMAGIGGKSLIDNLWYESFQAPVIWGYKK